MEKHNAIISTLLEVLILGVVITILLTQNGSSQVAHISPQTITTDLKGGGNVTTPRLPDEEMFDWGERHVEAVEEFSDAD